MKHITIVGLLDEKEIFLNDLKKIGLIHVEGFHPTEGETIKKLEALKTKIKSIINQCDNKMKPKKSIRFTADEKTLIRVQRLITLRETLNDKINTLKKMAKEAQWVCDISLGELVEIRNCGMDIHFYNIPKRELSKKLLGVPYLNLGENGNYIQAALWNLDWKQITYQEVIPGESSIHELINATERKEKWLKKINGILEQYLIKVPWQKYLSKIQETTTYEKVKKGLDHQGELIFCKGYCPNQKLKRLNKKVSNRGWALMVRDPLPDERPPTLMIRKKWVTLVDPIFKIMGAVPGYREPDISSIFLLFFTIFFAMIVGDAGYGTILFLLAVLLKVKIKTNIALVNLLLLLSCSTIIWGAITGNWFGYHPIAEIFPFNIFVLQSIDSFGQYSQDSMIYLSFWLAAIHLSLAHVFRVFQSQSWLKKISQLGWIVIVWCMFFIAKDQVLGIDLPQHFLGFALGGALLAFPFGILDKSQNKLLSEKLISGVFLKLINSFADCMSYIRLFAVGLATLAIAGSINQMANRFGFDSVSAGISGVVILIIGHSLNLFLAGIAVIVHGLRLNMLEFSTHAGNTWSGYYYNPFKSQIVKNEEHYEL